MLRMFSIYNLLTCFMFERVYNHSSSVRKIKALGINEIDFDVDIEIQFHSGHFKIRKNNEVQ